MLEHTDLEAAAAKQPEPQTTSFALQAAHRGLAGLMDGAIWTLAPLVAAVFATHSAHAVFLIGAAAAAGAGITMAFSEGLGDDGTQTGRDKPLVRGIITGIMTFLGGFVQTLPFLNPDLQQGLTLAYIVVGLELLAFAYIRYRYFATNFITSVIQVVVGGALVFTAGVLIGSS